MTSAVGIQQELEALQRGELDVDDVIGRLRGYIDDKTHAPTLMLDQLEQAREQENIGTAEYHQLTEFIVTMTGAGNLPSGRVEPSASDEPVVLVEVGTQLRDRFVLDEEIGSGGMGTVYKGRDLLKVEAKDRNPHIAVKVLNEDFQRLPHGFIALQREASRQQRLAHPNIATVYDFDRVGGVIYITMEYLDGRTLGDFIKTDVKERGGIPLDEVLEIIEPVCAALSYAHDRNILHADFKPGNCFLLADNTVKVLDFGIARAMKDPTAVDQDETVFDARSIGALTPAYASPEMLLNEEPPDPRDDIYGLACVTYELLTGTHPFNRIPAAAAKASGLKVAKVPSLTRRQNEAVARALAFEREDRTASAMQFLDELRGGQSSGPQVSGKWLAAAAAAAVIIAVGVFLPIYIDYREGEAVLDDVRSNDPVRIRSAVAQIPTLSQGQRARVLVESREAIVFHYADTFATSMGLADPEIDFQGLEDMLASAALLYPDSASMSSLNEQLVRRREAFLSELTSVFEDYLEPQRLRVNAQGDDLHDLLARIRRVDANHPLLTDDRIPAAFVLEIGLAIERDAYGQARELMDAGFVLFPADPGISNLSDRLQAIEREIARQEQVALLRSELGRRIDAMSSKSELGDIVIVARSLADLEPNDPGLSQSGELLTTKLSEEISGLETAQSLAPIDAFVLETGTVLRLLGQDSVLANINGRRNQLVGQQMDLVARTAEAMTAPDMSAAGQSIGEMLEALRLIDPADARIEQIVTDVVRERRLRSEAFARASQWQDARAELESVSALGLSQELQSAVTSDIEGLARAQQAENERIAETQRLELAEQEAATRRAIEQEQRQREAQRLASIDSAAGDLRDALSTFTPNRSQVAKVVAQIDALRKLDSGRVEIERGQARVVELVIAAANSRGAAGEFEAALRLLDDSSLEIGTNASLADARSSLVEDRAAAAEIDRLRAVEAARQRLDQLIGDRNRLVNADHRSAVDAQFRRLDEVGGDPTLSETARDRYVTNLVATATILIDQKRFTVAEQTLDAAAAEERLADLVGQAYTRLRGAEDDDRRDRERLETAARVAAAEQLVVHEANAGQLDRAEQTLESLRSMSPNSVFLVNEASTIMANAYARAATAQIETGDLDDARRSLDRGTQYEAGLPRLAAARTQLDIAVLDGRITGWFAGNSTESVQSMRSLVGSYRSLNPDGFDDAESEWAGRGRITLRSMRDDRAGHNQFLRQARSVLPRNATLAALEPIAPPPLVVATPPVVATAPTVAAPTASDEPSGDETGDSPQPTVAASLPGTTQPTLPDPVEPQPVEAQPVEAQPDGAQPDTARPLVALPSLPEPMVLSAQDIFGRWCGDAIQLEFSQDRLRFLQPNRADYDINEYRAEEDILSVRWALGRRSEMVFEFGQFSDDRNAMTQIRGRAVGTANWQQYNRIFNRCGG